MSLFALFLVSAFECRLNRRFWRLKKSGTSCPNWGEGGGGEVIWAMPKRKHFFFQEGFPNLMYIYHLQCEKMQKIQ